MKALLTAEHIDLAVKRADEFLSGKTADKKEKLRLLLWLEETLLAYREQFGEETEFDLRLGSAPGRKKLRLSVAGAMFDPFLNRDGEDSPLMRSYLLRLGQRPAWRYGQHKNTVTFSLAKKQMPNWAKLLLAVVSAIVLGLLIRFAPGNIRTLVQVQIFAPVLETFMDFLSAVAGPMIFLSVVWGIYSMGDADTFNTLGVRLSVQFLMCLVLSTLLMVCAITPFFHLSYGTGTAVSGLEGLYAMILDIVPDNLFRPFSTGNTLQILFVATIMGVTMIVMNEKTEGVAILAEQLSVIVQTIMEFIGRLVPFFIFGSLFNIVAGSDFSSLSVCGTFFFGTIAACVGMLLLHTVVFCVRLRVSPVLLWKKAFPTFLIGLSTASSSAAYASNLKASIQGFGVKEKLANFGVPFGQIVYMPGVSMVFFVSAVSVAESSGTEVSLLWLGIAAVLCMILSAATPAIPGGTTASFALLFAQLGLPSEELAVILALNILLDFFHTATNLFCGQCVLAISAEKVDMLDRAVLTDRAP